MTASISPRKMEAKRQWNIFKVLKQKTVTKIPYPAKSSFKNDDKDIFR